MTTKKLTKLLALYLPYILLGLATTNFGEAWRLAEGKELGDKIMSMMGTIPLAFANPLPSLHPLDLLVGLCCGAGLRLAVYLRGKNAKKYRHGMEYGSARWGTPKDIEPFMAPKFEDNIILTKTERLMMSNRPPDPKNARNKNVLVVGGSGSGKTRFLAETEPAAMQCHRFSGIIRGHRSRKVRVWRRMWKRPVEERLQAQDPATPSTFQQVDALQPHGLCPQREGRSETRDRTDDQHKR